jgi:glucan phosphoethanolaminetransferase (alkaline phosphatase superfamily)
LSQASDLSSEPPLRSSESGWAAGFGRWLKASRAARLGLFMLILLTPTLVVLGLDLERRASRVLEFRGEYILTYLAAVAEGTLLWVCLLYAAARRRGVLRWVNASLFVLAFTFTVGGQTYFFQQYNAYLNLDVSLFASNFKDSVINQLSADLPNYLRAKLPPFVVALGLVWAARRQLRPRRRPALVVGSLAPLLLVGSFFVPTQHRHTQASTPDVLYLNAIGGLIRTQLGFTDQSNQLRPRARESLPVPALTRNPTLPRRNVLFVILESVRADSVCVEHDPDCHKTGSTNQLFPDRFPLTEMRSLDSCTAVSLAVLWSGLLPTESRDTLHTWPLIFDYARASGYDTAFWTSQNMLFGNARLWVKNLGVSKFVSATDLDPTSDLDMGAPEGFLATRVRHEINELREPFLGVVQLSNVHYPYYIDPAGPMPFEPWSTSKASDDNVAFRNYYQNSVYQQDAHLAEMLSAIKHSPLGERTVIVYTSDHGEAFREHGQMGHTFSIFDEEIKVPAWIDAPRGTLSADEERALRSKRHAQLFHIDLAPTILDLIGVGGDPKISEYQKKMPGHSLLRPELTVDPVPMTNCAGVWSCAFENWGYMHGTRKLEARSWDRGWKCYDLATDPNEVQDLGRERCGDLIDLAHHTFGRLPGQGIEKQ